MILQIFNIHFSFSTLRDLVRFSYHFYNILFIILEHKFHLTFIETGTTFLNFPNL